MEMMPEWKLKRDPELHPVRFLAGLWQKQLAANFRDAEVQLSAKEYGQLKMLMKAVGALTPDVIEWMVTPVNWWRFCQVVRAKFEVHSAPPLPHLGFLLAHHSIGLKLMRSELSDSPAAAHFVRSLDQRRYEQLKRLLIVLADGRPEVLAKIDGAKTLIDMQRLFIAFEPHSAPTGQDDTNGTSVHRHPDKGSF
jgi:hypothetical protein